MVEIGGFQRISLMDYPGKITSIIFLTGCNMLCPFCHNGSLVKRDYSSLHIYDEEEILGKLSDSRNFIEAVTITGGEPTLQKDLETFLGKIKKTGLSVKLDTNGLNPYKLSDIIKNRLVDYVAMDIKTGIDNSKYAEATGLKGTSIVSKITKSINIIINSGIMHEFRTTLVPGLVTPSDLISISMAIRGADSYYLQQFNPNKTLDHKLSSVKPYPKNILDNACLEINRLGYVGHCEVRA